MQYFLLSLVLVFAIPLILFAAPVIVYIGPFILFGIIVSVFADRDHRRSRTLTH